VKANIEIEIGSEEIGYSLKEVIREIAENEIKQMVRQSAKEMVEQEVRNIIAPIIDKYLSDILVGRKYEYHNQAPYQTEVDKYIKAVLVKYLDEPSYAYSKTSNKLSERYAPSSSGGNKVTRAELWIIDKTREYAETELFVKLDKKIQDVSNRLIPNEEKMNEMIKDNLKALLT
jgi:hypothetical protein